MPKIPEARMSSTPTFTRTFRRKPKSLPKFQPRQGRAYARFYCLYEDMAGQRHRASFQVNCSKYAPRMKYHWVGVTVHRMKERYIPVCEQGQTFSSFPDLFASPWVRVRRILRYDAGVEYEK